jgi:hypothetical protein
MSAHANVASRLNKRGARLGCPKAEIILAGIGAHHESDAIVKKRAGCG